MTGLFRLFKKGNTVTINRQRGMARETWLRFLKNKPAVAGLFVISIIALTAIFADFISPYERGIEMNMADRFMPPGSAYIFGTDEFGRDQFTRIIHGGRRSLSIGVATTIIAITVGSFLAALCGYYGGILDTIIMRICDIFNCIPTFLLALAVVGTLGPSLFNLMAAITVASIPYYIRMVRSVILAVVEEDYIEAARACGTRGFKMITRHILPNAMGPIIVEASMSVAGMLLTAAGLSFIGMGIQPPTPEWGSMLSGGRDFIREHPHLIIFPGLSIAISALSLNLVGDGLRDALDPKLKE